MCRTILNIQDIDHSTDSVVPTPKWYDLYYKKGGAKSGSVLLSFTCVRAGDYTLPKLDHLFLENTVKYFEFEVSMNILGLRGLESPGLLPIKKAFLQFNLKSMVPPALGGSLENIKTEPKMAGSDPTLNTLIEFNAPLPKDTLFCPRMAVTVFDSIAMGLRQPTVGNFTIPIGDLMHELIKEREDEMNELENVLLKLDKMIKGEVMAESIRTIQKVKMEQEQKLQENDLAKLQV